MLAREDLRLRFWGAIREHAPKAWNELAGSGEKGLSAWLEWYNLSDPWCRELAKQQLRMWQFSPDARDKLLAIDYLHRPRLPEADRIFRFEVEGWRPDRTMVEFLKQFLGPPVQGDIELDGVGGWGEPWSEAADRIRQAFEDALAAHKGQVEARLAELHPPVKKKKSKLDSHLRLLVWYQVLERDYGELDGLEQADPFVVLQADTSRVRQAIEDTARRLGLTPRKSTRGRPRKPQNPKR